ncbi:TetR/AcrR family transcriptional regulator [Pseudonocardia adelaidensis]|uniref:HTH tetR-type domain-containing protein n=1 Tax=Pseudonocardia adelaidensis TaxID=648754 RepID=A0ABP9NSU3_9PSEU
MPLLEPCKSYTSVVLGALVPLGRVPAVAPPRRHAELDAPRAQEADDLRLNDTSQARDHGIDPNDVGIAVAAGRRAPVSEGPGLTREGRMCPWRADGGGGTVNETVPFRTDEVIVPGDEVLHGRGEAREEAILRATLELLAEVGYDRMSMDSIAVRARASKATIYRRWSGKAELVVTAVERRTGRQMAEQPDPGDLRQDLLGTLRAMRDGLTEQDAGLLLGLMTAMTHDEELADTVRARMIDDKRQAFDPVIDRAVTRGELPAATGRELLAEVASAMLFSRAFVTGRPLDDAFLIELVDQVLLPLLRHRAGGVS